MIRRDFLRRMAGAVAASPFITPGAVAAHSGLPGFASGGIGAAFGNMMPGTAEAILPLAPSSFDRWRPDLRATRWWSSKPTDARLWIDTMRSLSPAAKARMAERLARGRQMDGDNDGA